MAPLPHAFFLNHDHITKVATDGRRYVVAVGTQYHDFYHDYNDQLYVIDGMDGRLLRVIPTGYLIGENLAMGDGYVAYGGYRAGLPELLSLLAGSFPEPVVVRRLPGGEVAYQCDRRTVGAYGPELSVAGSIVRMGDEHPAYIDAQTGKPLSPEQAQATVDRLIADGKLSANDPWREPVSARYLSNMPCRLATDKGTLFLTRGLCWVAAIRERPCDIPRLKRKGNAREPSKHEDRPVRALAFSGDGQLLAASDWSTVRLLDPSNQEPEHSLPLEGTSAQKIIFSEDGRRLFAELRDFTQLTGSNPAQLVHIFDLATKDCIRRFNIGENLILSTAVSPDGRSLLVYSLTIRPKVDYSQPPKSFETVTLYDVDQGTFAEHTGYQAARNIGLGPGSTLTLLTPRYGLNRQTHLIADPGSRRVGPGLRWPGSPESIAAHVFSKDGTRLYVYGTVNAAASTPSWLDSGIYEFDASTGDLLRSSSGPRRVIEEYPTGFGRMALDDSILVVTENHYLRVFDLDQWKEIGAVECECGVWSLAVSTHAGLIATGLANGKVQLWEIPTRAATAPAPAP